MLFRSEQTIQTIASEIEQIAANALEAKNLSETAAVNALEAERNVQARANEIVEEATSQAVNAKNLSETAAVNALEAERNVESIKNEIEDFVVTAKKSVRTIGDQWVTFDGTIPEGGIPFHGQTLSTEVYQELYQWATANNRFIEETEWQQMKETNNGNVPYYSIVNETTFRVPFFNGYFKADIVGGSYVQEGLPNITGNYDRAPWEMEGYIEPTGAFYASGESRETPNTASFSTDRGLAFDASRSNSIYGNSEHVTPETTTVTIGVYATGTTVQNASNLDIDDVRNALSVANTYDSMPLLMSHWDKNGFVSPGWVKADTYWLSGDQYISAYNKILEKLTNGDEDVVEDTYTSTAETLTNPDKFLIDTTTRTFRLPFVSNEQIIVKKISNGKDNCTIYSNGICEQSGISSTGVGSSTVTFRVPFIDANYTFSVTTTEESSTDTGGIGSTVMVSNITPESFRLSQRTADIPYWNTKGITAIIPPSQYTENVALYFKLGNVFVNEDQMDATAISNKVDEIRNAWADADYVVESYTNGENWYRIYKNGWVEQGGSVEGGSITNVVNLLLPMFNANYDVSLTAANITQSNYNLVLNNKTETGFEIYANGEGAKASKKYWAVRGLGI